MLEMPEPPYVVVILSATRTLGDQGYAEMAARLDDLARQQPGYLGHESVHDDERSITISYWTDEEAAHAWKNVTEHRDAQRKGRSQWYADYSVHVATVTRSYAEQGSSLV